MKIEPEGYYAIVAVGNDGRHCYAWYKNKIYFGWQVKNVYKQLKDKPHYKIYSITGLTECEL